MSLCFIPIGAHAAEKTNIAPVQKHGKLSVKETNIVDKNGKLEITANNIETLGRDISIVGEHPDSEKPAVKVIIDADTDVKPGLVKLNVKPHKCFVFDLETEERIW